MILWDLKDWEEMKECIILAGGLGTRLQGVVPGLPKCMALVAGKPFIEWVIDYWRQEGIEQFIVAVGYKHTTVIDWLTAQKLRQPNLVDIQVTIEEEPLGTGGAAKLACSKVMGESVLLLNGDTLFKVDLQQLTAFHDRQQADCSLSLKPMRNVERYGTVSVRDDGRIDHFREKQPAANGLINGGVYALQTRQFLAEDLPPAFSFEKDYLEKMVGSHVFGGLIQDEYFIDIGTPEDYAKANVDLKM